MKNQLKKISSLILVLSMGLTISATSFAEPNNYNSKSTVTEGLNGENTQIEKTSEDIIDDAKEQNSFNEDTEEKTFIQLKENKGLILSTAQQSKELYFSNLEINGLELEQRLREEFNGLSDYNIAKIKINDVNLAAYTLYSIVLEENKEYKISVNTGNIIYPDWTDFASFTAHAYIIDIKDGTVDSRINKEDLKAAIFEETYVNIVPDGKNAEVKIEYDAGVWGLHNWHDLEFVPNKDNILELALHEFGDGSAELVRITYKGISKTVKISLSGKEPELDTRLVPAPVFKAEPVYNYYEGKKNITSKDVLATLIDDQNTSTPDLLDEFDNGNVTVQYDATGNGDWKDFDFIPSSLQVFHHSFGKEQEKIKVSFKGNDTYKPGKWEIDLSLKDLRIPTQMTFLDDLKLLNSFITVYGNDLRKAIVPHVFVKTEEDIPQAISFEETEVTLEKEALDAAPFVARELKVTYSGNETYKGCEGIAKVYVMKAGADLDITGDVVFYGNTPNIKVKVEPETLDYLPVVVGIEGTKDSYISIQLPESVKNSMKIEFGMLSFDIYEKLKNRIGDGITLERLREFITETNDELNKKPMLSDKTWGEMAGFDMESLNKAVEFINKIPTVNHKTVIKLDDIPEEVGAYLICAVSTDPNYELSFGAGQLYILPKINPDIFERKPVTIEVPDMNLTRDYDGTEQAVMLKAAASDGTDVTDELSYSYTGDITAGTVYYGYNQPPKEPGKYIVNVCYVGNNYYKPATKTVVFEIKGLSPVIEIKDKTVTYNGLPHEIDCANVTLPGNKKYLGTVKYVYYRDKECKNAMLCAPVEAGTYYVKAYIGSYNGEYVSSNTATLTITPCSLDKFEVSLSDNILTYTGEHLNPDYSVNNKVLKPIKLKKDRDYTISYSQNGAEVNSEDVVNAGEYTVKAVGKGNYTDTASATFTVLPKVTVIDTMGYTLEQGSTVASFSAKAIDGKYEITDDMLDLWKLNDGTYSVVIEFGNRTDTDKLVVDKGLTETPSEDIVKGNIHTRVESGIENIPVVVSNLSTAANNIVETEDIELADNKVEFVLSAKEATQDRKASAKSKLAMKANQVAQYIDITVKMTVTTISTGQKSVEEKEIKNTGDVLEMIMPFDMNIPQGAAFKVFRLHDNEEHDIQVTTFKEITDASNIADGTYMIKTNEDGSKQIALYGNLFSVYVLTYEEPVKYSGGGGGGGSGGVSTKYKINVPDNVENGTIELSKNKAAAMEKVNFTVKPDEDFELIGISVKDVNGKVIKCDCDDKGVYSFSMPSKNVYVSAEFGEKLCPKDETCVIEQFTDTKNDAWWHDAIHYCVAKKIMVGVSDTLFAPNVPITRSMIVVTLWRMENSPKVGFGTEFADVAFDKYYYDAIRWASQNKIIEGHDKYIFAPENDITREQMTAIIIRYLRYKNIDIENLKTIACPDFDDNFMVSEWAKDCVIDSVETGFISGMGNNRLEPQNSTTRAEFATVIMKLAKFMNKYVKY